MSRVAGARRRRSSAPFVRCGPRRGGGWVRRGGGGVAAAAGSGGVREGRRQVREGMEAVGGTARCSERKLWRVFNLMNNRVGLGRVGPTPTADKSRRFPPFPPSRHDRHGYGGRHGAAIPNPPRHRYSVAFFRKPAMENRHGAAMAAI